MKTTIKDVAKEAQVSIGTVSRVLNGKDRVSKATRMKVQEAIAQLGFIPDRTARTMIRKQTQSIGLVVPVLSNEYWAKLAELVQEAAWEKGYSLLLCAAGFTLDKHLESIAMLADRKVDGIIAGLRLQHPQDARRLQEAAFFPDLPMVSLDQRIPHAVHIGVDHFHGSVQAVEHLISLGHTRIAYIGMSPSDRELGYRHALQSNGILIDEALIQGGEGTFASGARSAGQLLNEKRRFTAVFCWNDMSALGAIQILEQHGLSVPGDVSVVGYDDIPMASLVKPALTTVRQPLQEMGRAAVRSLIGQIEAGGTGSERAHLFSAELVVRDSSGACAGPG